MTRSFTPPPPLQIQLKENLVYTKKEGSYFMQFVLVKLQANKVALKCHPPWTESGSLHDDKEICAEKKMGGKFMGLSPSHSAFHLAGSTNGPV